MGISRIVSITYCNLFVITHTCFICKTGENNIRWVKRNNSFEKESKLSEERGNEKVEDADKGEG